MNQLQTHSVDIVIVGAGLVGAPLAYALAIQGWSVALLDEQVQKASQPQPEQALQQRCTALSLGSQQWLAKLGLWPFVAEDACRIEQVHVSHKGNFGSTRLHASEMGADALGFVVNNDQVTQTFKAALQNTNVKLCSGVKVKSVRYQSEGVTVLSADQSFEAKLLIAADGVSSVIREAAGINTRQIDYEQLAVLGTVQIENVHEQVAYERFTGTGPLALLPRPGKYMSFVDCIEPDQREHIQSLDNSQYRERLQSRFGYRLGRFEAVGPRFITPLMRIEATRQVAERTVLMGNAMRLLHPVGGQGYNLALRDAAGLQLSLEKLRAQFATDHDSSADPGVQSLLLEFESNRLGDQARIVNLTDLLARGFRGEASVPAHAKALSLIGLDTIPPLRKRFAALAMGIAG